MTKTTIEQFCRFLVDKYLSGKTFSEISWVEIYRRVERQNLTLAEEMDVRSFVSAKHSQMLREESRRLSAIYSKKAPKLTMA